MNAEIRAMLQEANQWVLSQPTPAPQSEQWYALSNFWAFIQDIELDPTETGLHKAIHALRHHIVDQFDWSSDYCKSISGFCDRADRIRRKLKNG